MPLVLKLIADPVEVLACRAHTVIKHVQYFPDFTTITLLLGIDAVVVVF